MPQDDEAAARDRVATLIRADIERGVYPPGARLPSYRRLAELFSVAPNTAGAAVGLLRQAGLVDIRRNSGAYVRDRENAPATPDLRAELRELNDQISRAKRDLSAAQKRIAGLLDHVQADGRSE
ncbi:MAG: GntR family transcriptional regulator [Streptosporangiaceae bacterium]